MDATFIYGWKMAQTVGQLIMLMGILGILMLLLAYQVTTYCNDTLIEEMNGEVVLYKKEILKVPTMIVNLTNGDSVEVDSDTVCKIGSRIRIKHIEGNCNNGWKFDGVCP